jgi:RNA polymerase sigma factor (sigma-70 family)
MHAPQAGCWYREARQGSFEERWQWKPLVERFVRFYGENRARVGRVLEAIAGPKAAELTDEVFLRVWKAYKHKPAEEWLRLLLGTAKNAAIDHLRPVRPELAEAAEEFADARAAAGEPDREEARRCFLSAFWRLSPDHQLILILVDFCRLSFERIGTLLGTSENAAQLRRKRAMEALEVELRRKGME